MEVQKEQMTQIKIKDFQFARYFLTSELGDLDKNIIDEILDFNIQIVNGEPDTVIDRGNKTIVLANPTSLSRTLFNILYTSLSKFIVRDEHKDKLGLGLLQICNHYVYNDPDATEIKGPPVLVSSNKIDVVKFFIEELVEPIHGTIKKLPLFFIKCKFTDCCRKITSENEITRQYLLPKLNIGFSNYPMLLCNLSIQNYASLTSHIIINTLEENIGQQKTQDAIKCILSTPSLLEHLRSMIFMLRSETDFIVDFVKYLGSYVFFNEQEMNNTIASTNEIYNPTKTAQHNTQQVFKQWSQWSMLMGLIEKQLTPMRGSMWPASMTIKPIEDQLRKKQKEIASKKNKNQLNFEELLETARNMYNHNAIEPGKITETLIKDLRVWK